VKKTNKIYKEQLNKLVERMDSVKNTPYTSYVKVIVLTVMNLRYEKIAFNKNITEHPYILTRNIINNAYSMFDNFIELEVFENINNENNDFNKKSLVLEVKHKELWQEIWSRHNKEEFEEFVDMKLNRLVINDLLKYINGKKCVDFGCGNGSFSFALIQAGALKVQGIDFGVQQVKYASRMAKDMNLSNADFKEAEVFDTGLKSNSFDFAISNGVFHHLSKNNMKNSVREVSRVLKKDAYFWYYIDGKGAISMDLWDRSVDILKDINVIFIENVLKNMNLTRNKTVHVMDALSATYYHSSLEETTEMLSKYGFGKFRRLIGGEPTDFDLDVVTLDPYGKEKFGCGDLRILCQLVKK
jgi:2-polyprenyl-3-methyl-5-hydroxy-6-metoxy-1,4-benzoquinol methylase